MTNKKLGVFFRLLTIANAITIIPAAIIILLFLIIVTPLEDDSAQGAGMALGLASVPFMLGSIPILLINIIALPIILAKNTLSARATRNCKIVIFVSIGIVTIPCLILVINNLFINPQ